MPNRSITLELPEELWENVKFAASGEDSSPSELIATVLSAYLDAEDRKALEQAILESESDEVGTPHEEVERWLEQIQARVSKAA